MTTLIQDINEIVADNAPANKTFLFGIDDEGNPQLVSVTATGELKANVSGVELGDIVLNTEGLATETTLAGIKAAVEQVGVDRYPNSSFFVAKQNFTGATAGDIIQNITLIDATTQTVIVDIWRNKDTGLDLASAPVIGTDIEYVGANGLTYEQLLTAGLATQTTLATLLTDTQLRATPVPVSGTFYQATQPVSIASWTGLTDTQLRDTPVPVSGTVTANPSALSSVTVTSVNDAATVQTLAASNANRRMLMITNDSTAVLYLKLGSAATTTDYSVKLAADDYWEMPQPIYTGIVTGIWASDASGAAKVSEGV